MKTLTTPKVTVTLTRTESISLKQPIKPVVSGFTYDLNAMKQALSQTKIPVPKSALESEESFDDWLNS